MPAASPLVSGGLFVAGVVIGLGAGAAVSSSSSKRPQIAASPSNEGIPASSSGPIIDVARKEGNGPFSVGGSGFGAQGREIAREVFRYGFPGPTPDILHRTSYVAAYDRRMRHPAWTAEHLTAANLGRAPSPPSSPPPGNPSNALAAPPATTPPPALAASSSSSTPLPTVLPGPDGGAGQVGPKKDKGDRSRSQFVEDAEVPGMFRALLKDYFRSGYDRGHMVPAADAKISQQAMDETFLLTNIAPQVGEGFNRHYWAYLEDFCRRLTGSFQDVYVFTIPLYLPAQGPDGKWRVSYEVIGNPPSISVPTHFAKVILTSKAPQSSINNSLGSLVPASSRSDIRELAVGAFVLPNAPIPDETPLRTFLVPVETVEKAAGLTLFSPTLKQSARQLCQETRCDVVVRRFDDTRKQLRAQGQQGKGL